MTKHSRNATDSAVFSYNERRAMQHGSKKMRVPGVALKEWNHCSLSFCPAEIMVLTQNGVLFDKEAILRHLLLQRTSSQERGDAKDMQQDAEAEAEKKRRAECFENAESQIHVSKDLVTSTSDHDGKSDMRSAESSFWIPGSNLTSSRKRAIEKPARRSRKLKTKCPVTGQSLRSKDLVLLNPMKLSASTAPGPTSGGDLQGSKSTNQFICAVCYCVLTNATKPVALRTGTVLCSDCSSRVVKEDGVDPITNARLDPAKDIIPIRSGGTAYSASSGEAKEGTVYNPSVR